MLTPPRVFLSIKIFNGISPPHLYFSTRYIFFLIQNTIFNYDLNMPGVPFDIEHIFRIFGLNLYDKDQNQGDNH